MQAREAQKLPFKLSKVGKCFTVASCGQQSVFTWVSSTLGVAEVAFRADRLPTKSPQKIPNLKTVFGPTKVWKKVKATLGILVGTIWSVYSSGNHFELFFARLCNYLGSF